MKNICLCLSMLVLIGSFSLAYPQQKETHPGENPKKEVAEMSQSQKATFPQPGEAPVVGQQEVEALIASHGADLLVVNMWATYCAPCVAELPYFVELSKKYDSDQVKVLGVSLDFKNQVEKRVLPFLEKKEISFPVVVFFGDPGPMIDFLAAEWQGDLPATFIYDKNGKQIGNWLRPMEKEELFAEVEKALRAQKTENKEDKGNKTTTGAKDQK